MKQQQILGSMAQIVAVWKAVAATPHGCARNGVFWACVQSIEAAGFVGNARRLLERSAAWHD